jgi:hypothetical protein
MKALSLSVRPSFFWPLVLPIFFFVSLFKEVLGPSVSSSVFASAFFFADRFCFFFGGCTDLKDCARELVANCC